MIALQIKTLSSTNREWRTSVHLSVFVVCLTLQLKDKGIFLRFFSSFKTVTRQQLAAVYQQTPLLKNNLAII